MTLKQGEYTSRRLHQLKGEEAQEAPGKLLIMEILLRNVGIHLEVLVGIQNFSETG